MLETRNFLLPDATLIIEIVAFVVVLVIMSRYVLPHIRRAVTQRQTETAAALTSARDAEQRQAHAEQDAFTVRADARRQARQITDQAREMRDHLIAEGRRQGQEEYRWLSGRALREFNRRSELTRRQAHREAIIATLDVIGDTTNIAISRKPLTVQVEQRLRPGPAEASTGRACVASREAAAPARRVS